MTDVRDIVPDIFKENPCLYLHCLDLPVEKVLQTKAIPSSKPRLKCRAVDAFNC